MPGNFHAVPASVLKSWPKPNYIDPVKRAWLPAFAYSFLGFSTVLIAGRFYLRARKLAGDFGLDDLFIFIGWLVSVGVATCAIVGVQWYGIDVHTWDVPPTEFVGAALNGFIAQVLFLVSTCATKTSVLLFYRRMAKDTYSRLWLYGIWFALAFTAVYFVGVLITYCFICQPLSAYWLSYDFSYDKPFTCIDGNILSPFVGVLSVVSDIYAVVLPCAMLQSYDLDVPRRQKVLLNVIFSLGLIVAGCGIARTYYLWKIDHTFDTSWTGFDLYVWSLLECHLAVIFACAPSLRAFLRRYLGESLRSTFRSRDGSRNKSSIQEKGPSELITSNSSILAEPELGKAETTVDARGVAKWSDQATTSHANDFPTRLYSSEAIPTIKTADDYEAYAMEQIYRFKRSNTVKSTMTGETTHETSNDLEKRHDLDNARSWLDDEWLN